MEAVQRIYAHHVHHGAASFEETAPDLAQMQERRSEVLRQGLPYLVAEISAEVVGYAYASDYRSRSAYRYTLEDSVYVAAGQARRGIGRALLGALIAGCERGPWRQMIAVIGDSANSGSIGVHASLGFARIGTLQAVGFKFGRWVDCVLMQRELGAGAATLPAGLPPR